MSLAVLAVATALRLALNSEATWEMERHLPDSARTLVSSGTVSCVLGSGIVWRVDAPFSSCVTMTTNAMIFVDEEGRREKPLAELPYYEQIRARTDAFAAGDANAFDGIFTVTQKRLPPAGWELKLVPQIDAMKQLFTGITVQGDRLPTNVVMRLGDGGTSVIRFKERPRVR